MSKYVPVTWEIRNDLDRLIIAYLEELARLHWNGCETIEEVLSLVVSMGINLKFGTNFPIDLDDLVNDDHDAID